jgi:hypothetical protein
VWTPTWVTAVRRIAAFHARVIRVDAENGPAIEAGLAYQGLSAVEILALDRFVATSVARELTAQFFSTQPMGLTVPIHWMSLAPRSRECIRMPFESCPPKARRKLLKVEVFGFNAAISPAMLRSMVDPLERLGCDIMARLPLSAYEIMSGLRAARSIRAVGVDLSDLEADERVGDEDLYARLVQFRETARENGLACYVWGVRRRPLVARLVRNGFSLVNGPGVMNAIPSPCAIPAAGAA